MTTKTAPKTEPKTIAPPTREDAEAGHLKELLERMNQELAQVRHELDLKRSQIKSAEVQFDAECAKRNQEIEVRRVELESSYKAKLAEADAATREITQMRYQQEAMRNQQEQVVVELQARELMQIDFNRERYEIELLRNELDQREKQLSTDHAEAARVMETAKSMITEARAMRERAELQFAEYIDKWNKINAREQEVERREKQNRIVSEQIAQRLGQRVQESSAAVPDPVAKSEPTADSSPASEPEAPAPSIGTIPEGVIGTVPVDPATGKPYIGESKFRTLEPKDSGQPLN